MFLSSTLLSTNLIRERWAVVKVSLFMIESTESRKGRVNGVEHVGGSHKDNVGASLEAARS